MTPSTTERAAVIALAKDRLARTIGCAWEPSSRTWEPNPIGSRRPGNQTARGRAKRAHPSGQDGGINDGAARVLSGFFRSRPLGWGVKNLSRRASRANDGAFARDAGPHPGSPSGVHHGISGLPKARSAPKSKAPATALRSPCPPIVNCTRHIKDNGW